MGSGVLYLIYIVYPHPRDVNNKIIWWEGGIIHTPLPPDQRLIITRFPHRHTFILYNISHPLPDPRLYPNPRKIFGTSSLPLHFTSHSITFSYTLSTISMTTSYSMVGVRWCATLLRGEFVRVSSITMLFFFTCIVFPTLSIVSLSSSINVLSIYSHSLSFWVG